MNLRLQEIYLKPGELAIARRPTKVTTVLGSCVSVTFFCRVRGIGAICHAMLPEGNDTQRFKYVDEALSHMLAQFRKIGVKPCDIQAKLFGGADMFEANVAIPGNARIGSKNSAAAQAFLQRQGIPVVARDIGGNGGRKLIFFSHTGDVYMKRLHKERWLSDWTTDSLEEFDQRIR